jgi:hypothetical protein
VDVYGHCVPTNRERVYLVEGRQVIFSFVKMPYLQLGAKHQHLKLHYELHGSGPIKILFIMGFLADGDAWMFQVDATGNDHGPSE